MLTFANLPLTFVSSSIVQSVTSQGEVVGVGPGFVELRIDREQFPGLEDIYNNQSDSGRWLRRFRMVGGKCQLVDEEDNKQVNILPELLYISDGNHSPKR